MDVLQARHLSVLNYMIYVRSEHILAIISIMTIIMIMILTMNANGGHDGNDNDYDTDTKVNG